MAGAAGETPDKSDQTPHQSSEDCGAQDLQHAIGRDNGDASDGGSHGSTYSQGTDNVEDSGDDHRRSRPHGTGHDRRSNGIARVVYTVHHAIGRSKDHHHEKHRSILS